MLQQFSKLLMGTQAAVCSISTASWKETASGGADEDIMCSKHLQLIEGIVGDGTLPASCDHHILIATQDLLKQTLQCCSQPENPAKPMTLARGVLTQTSSVTSEPAWLDHACV